MPGSHGHLLGKESAALESQIRDLKDEKEVFTARLAEFSKIKSQNERMRFDSMHKGTLIDLVLISNVIFTQGKDRRHGLVEQDSPGEAYGCRRLKFEG